MKATQQKEAAPPRTAPQFPHAANRHILPSLRIRRNHQIAADFDGSHLCVHCFITQQQSVLGPFHRLSGQAFYGRQKLWCLDNWR